MRRAGLARPSMPIASGFASQRLLAPPRRPPHLALRYAGLPCYAKRCEAKSGIGLIASSRGYAWAARHPSPADSTQCPFFTLAFRHLPCIGLYGL
jgi:hypothetical protein